MLFHAVGGVLQRARDGSGLRARVPIEVSPEAGDSRYWTILRVGHVSGGGIAIAGRAKASDTERSARLHHERRGNWQPSDFEQASR
jgi:hypothetical protein